MKKSLAFLFGFLLLCSMCYGQGSMVYDRAADISVTPVGSVASTNVQSAIQELDSEKLATGGTAAAATVATTVTITDNESTAENNPIVFVADGDLDGGNLGLESDGTAYYTPSTGLITATGFVGALTGTASGNLISGGTLTSGYHCRYDGAGLDCDRVEDASGDCASNAVCMGGHTHTTYAPLISPSFTTPTLGAATATSINKLTITAPATSATLTIANGKTLTATNTVNLNTMTDEQICNYEGTGTQINCDLAIDASGDCASGSLCGGDHTHSGYLSAETNSLETLMTGVAEHEIPLGTSADTATYTAIPSCSGATNALTYNTTTHVLGCNTIAGAAHDAVTLAGEDYLSLSTQEITAKEMNSDNINWPDFVNGLLGSAGINWTDIETLKSVKSSGINWQNLEEISKSDINWATIQNLTVDSIGEITVDDTTGQFRYHDGTAQRVLTWNDRRCFGWFDPADADDDIEVWTFKYAATVTNITCRVSGGTSVAVVGGDGTNAFESIPCDADGATDDGSITNATFTAGEVLELDLGAPSGTVPSFTYCIDFTNTAD